MDSNVAHRLANHDEFAMIRLPLIMAMLESPPSIDQISSHWSWMTVGFCYSVRAPEGTMKRAPKGQRMAGICWSNGRDFRIFPSNFHIFYEVPCIVEEQDASKVEV